LSDALVQAGSAIAYDALREGPLLVPMRDGTKLATTIYRPDHGGKPAPGPFPAIVERTPYGRGRIDLHAMGMFFAARGYVVAVQDVRGQGDSEGEFSFFLHSHEAQDGYDTVEWIAAQSWCDGRVGTTGLSFAGANQQALAVLRPPHLTTQVVLDCGFNYWRRCARNEGAVQDGVLVPYAFAMGLRSREAAADPAVKRAFRDALDNLDVWIRRLPLRRGASPLALAPAHERWFFDLVERADYDDAWRDPMPNLEAHVGDYPDIPVCFVTSWYGLHSLATTQKVNVLLAQGVGPVHATFGIWLHAFDYMQQTWAGQTDFGLDAAQSLDDFRLRWFDRWLKQLETPDPPPAPYRLFVMGGGSGRMNAAGRMDHGGRWREEPAWPLERAVVRTLHLHADGTLRGERPEAASSSSSYTFDPRDPVPTIGGHTMGPLAGQQGILYAGGYDQRGRTDLLMCRDTLPLAMRQDVLAFRTAPLEEAVEVTGPVVARLWVSSSARDTDFVARLIDEHPPNADYPEGFALNLSDWIVRMRYRNGRERAELIEPGEVYEVTLELPPTSNVFGAGHRIRLDVTSSSSPQFDVNPNTGGPLYRDRGWVVARNTLFHDAARPSSLELSFVGDVSGSPIRRKA
jgi:putative CocE/NonD family hydrolase